MAQVTLNLPVLPKDWHSTLAGLVGAIGLQYQQYTKTGTVTVETLIIAAVVAVLGYFIPAKSSLATEAAMVDTITGLVKSTVGAKLPALVSQQLAVNPLAATAVDAVVAVTAVPDQAAPTVAAPTA